MITNTCGIWSQQAQTITIYCVYDIGIYLIKYDTLFHIVFIEMRVWIIAIIIINGIGVNKEIVLELQPYGAY